MKTKKVPIFLEFMKKSFFIISLILIIYTIGQLLHFGFLQMNMKGIY